MEKRRLLLVVMLLVTSGAALAMDGGEEPAKPKRSQRLKAKTKKGWHATIRFVTAPARWFHRTRPADEFTVDLSTVPAAEDETIEVKQSTLEDLLEQYDRVERRLLYGTTIALTAALIYTARNQRVQEAARGLVRRVRSLRLRKRTNAPVDKPAPTKADA